MRQANRSADLPSRETRVKHSGSCSRGPMGRVQARPTGPRLQLKADRELSVEGVTEIAPTVLFVLKAVLNLQLRVWREPVSRRDVGAPKVVPPRSASSVSIWHVAEKLLVPANGAEK